jgi:hypothetical protein
LKRFSNSSKSGIADSCSTEVEEDGFAEISDAANVDDDVADADVDIDIDPPIEVEVVFPNCVDVEENALELGSEGVIASQSANGSSCNG